MRNRIVLLLAVPAAVFEAWVVEAEERRAAEARTIAPAVATAAG